MALFGTSGIRGKTGSEMTPELFYDIAKASIHIFQNDNCSLAIGRDTRIGAAMLACSVMAGAMNAGADVYDAGVITTPGLAYTIKSKGLSGGLMITGSHMPPDRIGLMVMNSEGSHINEQTSNRLEAHLKSNEKNTHPSDYGEYFQIISPFTGYLEWLKSVIDIDLISQRQFAVGLDAANGAASGYFSSMLRTMKIELHSINDTPKSKPDRESEPRDSTLTQLKSLVKEKSLDLGIAFDIDADRVSFIDESGHYVSEDMTGALLASHSMPEKNGVLVTPINSSGLSQWLAANRHARIINCRIGHPAIVQSIKEFKAHFAYEESGKYYFPSLALYPDGMLSALKMLEILATSGKPLSGHAAEFPLYYQMKYNMDISPEMADYLRKELRKKLLNWAPLQVALRDETDGFKLVFRDGSWLLLRLSGTEPLLRIYSDSSDRVRAKELADMGHDFARRIINSKSQVPNSK